MALSAIMRQQKRIYTCLRSRLLQTAATIEKPQARSEVPIVDISPFINTTSSKREKRFAARELFAACTNVGTAYLIGHGVDQDVLNNVLVMGHKLFDLPKVAKDTFTMRHSRGHQDIGEIFTQNTVDMQEAFDVYREYDEGHPLYNSHPHITARNRWPSEHDMPGFKALVSIYSKQMLRLGDGVMSAVAVSLGLEEHHFYPYYSDSHWYTRIIGYPTPDHMASKESNNIGCGEHTDYGCLVLMNQDLTETALQVKTSQGQWLNVEPREGTIPITIGDMLAVWTNGIYLATPHRVLRPTKCRRVSAPFFFEPNFSASITPIDSFIGKDPSAFKKIRYGDHLLSKIRNNP